MPFTVGQKFMDIYPSEAAYWCNNLGNVYITELPQENGHRVFQIVKQSIEDTFACSDVYADTKAFNGVSPNESKVVTLYKDPISIEQYEKDKGWFGILHTFLHFNARDRFGIMNKYSSTEWSNRVQSIPHKITDSFESLCDKRAKEILAKYPEGYIGVSWSGGTDSNTVAIALLKNIDKPERIKLICTSSSIDEFPGFVPWISKQGVDVIAGSPDVYKTALAENVVVLLNGNCGDQQFSSLVNTDYPEYYLIPVEEGIKKVYEQTSLEELIEPTIERIKEYGSKLGLDIKTFGQASLLCNYGIKWEYVATLQQSMADCTKLAGKCITFFDTPEFSDYAFTHFYETTANNPVTKPYYYKRPMKDYILSLYPDKDFVNNTGKIDSVSNANLHSWKDNYIVAFCEDGEFVYFPKHKRDH